MKKYIIGALAAVMLLQLSSCSLPVSTQTEEGGVSDVVTAPHSESGDDTEGKTDQTTDPLDTVAPPSTPDTEESTAETEETRPTVDESELQYSEMGFTVDLTEYEKYMNPEDRDAYLILVNAKNPLPEDHIPEDLTGLADTRDDGRDTQEMRLYAAKSLEAFLKEARAAGCKNVSVTSAYRSYSRQNYLYNIYIEEEMANDPSLSREEAEEIVKTYSCKAGTSEHQTGLCCDMHNMGSAQQSFAEKPEAKWLAENAWKFGFILRFPEDKEDITEIIYEPWHFRYVGRYHAKQMTDLGMCLEEYIEYLDME